MINSRKNLPIFTSQSLNNSGNHVDFYPKTPTLSSNSEAMEVFNQVVANKHKILKKGSDTFYSKRTIKTLKVDLNGSQLVEKFESTTFGGFTPDGEKVGEVIQKYSNEETGIEKTSLQRNFGNRVRRIEKRKTQELELTNEYAENLDSEFDKEWRVFAKNLGVKRILGFENKVDTMDLPKGF